MCMADGGESYQVYRTLTRCARNPHRCDECGRQISAGENYQYFTGLYDGHWDTHRTCAQCQVGIEWLRFNCGGVVHEAVFEDLREHCDEYPPLAPQIARLLVGMRNRWVWKSGAAMPPPRLPDSINSLLSEAA